MIWMAVQESSDMLKLTNVKSASLNQSNSMAGQLCLNIERRIDYSHQLLVALDCSVNILGDTAAWIATNAISIDRKLEFLIPVSLLLGVKQEGPSAIVTLPLNVVVVRVQHARPVLLRGISYNGGSRNEESNSGATTSTKEFGQLCLSVGPHVNSNRMCINIKPRHARLTTVARVLDIVAPALGDKTHILGLWHDG